MEHTRMVLHDLAEWVVLLVDCMAVTVAVAGSIITFIAGARWLCSAAYRAQTPIRTIWIWYARWLVAALTFLLAADIIETTIAPTYEDLIRLGVIALIRTFLNYFLDKDLQEFQTLQREAEERHGA
ncbi:DUF1622 domain-containing protein [Lysobacter soli]|uniref:DUF1622 domain-containing protein n=1 Tax=Lysobacter soli TaxID=453783 RepID=UPI0037CB3754